MCYLGLVFLCQHVTAYRDLECFCLSKSQITIRKISSLPLCIVLQLLFDAKLDIQFVFQEGSTPIVDSVASIENIREQSILISPSIGEFQLSTLAILRLQAYPQDIRMHDQN